MIRYVVLVALFIQPLAACSVYMAAAGDKEPNLSNVRKDASRSEIEIHLGQPTRTYLDSDSNQVAVYQYTIGNEPSAGRAIGHGVLDVVTLGLWEIIGTPVEATQQGETYELTVTYDDNDQVTELSTHKISG